MFYVELDKFMAVLDQRLSARKLQPAVGIVAKKVRRVGDPSKTVPPVGAPSWAVRSNWPDELTSMYHYDMQFQSS